MIKSEAIGNVRGTTDYPRLKVNERGMVVLFVGKETGAVVVPDKIGQTAINGTYGTLGYHSTEWDPEAFADWSGTVKLTQD